MQRFLERQHHAAIRRTIREQACLQSRVLSFVAPTLVAWSLYDPAGQGFWQGIPFKVGRKMSFEKLPGQAGAKLNLAALVDDEHGPV